MDCTVCQISRFWSLSCGLVKQRVLFLKKYLAVKCLNLPANGSKKGMCTCTEKRVNDKARILTNSESE